MEGDNIDLGQRKESQYYLYVPCLSHHFPLRGDGEARKKGHLPQALIGNMRLCTSASFYSSWCFVCQECQESKEGSVSPIYCSHQVGRITANNYGFDITIFCVSLISETIYTGISILKLLP